jgi:uncharacterized membrane protein YphA (DoxX/SURF4 family)
MAQFCHAAADFGRLFQNLPEGQYHYPASAVMAFLSGCGEITFPVLLVLGFATRFAALGLLFMAAIVELTVPDGWPIRITWAAMTLGIMAWGPGRNRATLSVSRDRYNRSCRSDGDAVKTGGTSRSTD